MRAGAGGPGRGVLAVVVVLAGSAACGEAPDRADDAAPAGNETAAVTAVGPWVRVAIVPEGSDAPDAPPVNSAAYLVLRNATGEADALVAVAAAVSDTAEIHTVTMTDGVMRMRAVDSVPLPAGGEAVLEPGGYHVMLIGLRGPLVEGDTVALRLSLRSGRTLDVAAPVLRAPPR